MADEIDQANELAELAMTVAIRNMNSGKKMAARGTCYWCEATIETPKLFCDSECTAEYEDDQRRKSRR